jgi:hypothetical protein
MVIIWFRVRFAAEKCVLFEVFEKLTSAIMYMKDRIMQKQIHGVKHMGIYSPLI